MDCVSTPVWFSLWSWLDPQRQYPLSLSISKMGLMCISSTSEAMVRHVPGEGSCCLSLASSSGHLLCLALTEQDRHAWSIAIDSRAQLAETKQVTW